MRRNCPRMSAKNGLTYRILTEVDHAEVVQFIQKNFIPFEPLSVAVGVRAEEEKNFPELLIKNSLWQKVSIGVFDNSNGELCALRLNMLGKHMKSLPYDDNSSKHSQNFNAMARILSYAKEDLEQYFPDENFMEHEFVVVNQGYGRRGIATELYKQSEILAREHGCDRMRVTCSNYYTRRSVEKVGYIVLKELLYVDYQDIVTGLRPFTTMPPPHTGVAVLMKNVVKEEQSST